MNILYGIQATGNGHLTRSREVVFALRRFGHDVDVLLSGRPADKLWDVDDLQPFQIKPGLTFAVSGGRIAPWATVRGLDLRGFYRDIRAFDARGVDVVMSDFEPLSVRIAKRHGLMSIGLAHQYAFQYAIPKPRGRWLNRAILAGFAPVDVPLGLHWHHFNAPILPPIVPRLLPGTTTPGKVVVYLPFEDPAVVSAVLRCLSGWQFYVYRDVPAPGDDGHVHIRPFSREGFREDLVTAETVLANAGFELASEALHLGKRLIIRPIRGQMEQEANAMACEALGLGTVLRAFKAETVRDGLEGPMATPRPVPDWVDGFARWIGRAKWTEVNALLEASWRQAPCAPQPTS